MNIPSDLVRLIHLTLANHYRQHHRADDSNRAELFAESLGRKLLGPIVQADANRAVAHLDIQELPWVSSGADEVYQLAGILREVLCQEVKRWLEQSGVWKYNPREKALAYARAVANAVDGGTDQAALQSAKAGRMPIHPYDDLSEEERRCYEAEARHATGRRR